MSHHGRAPSANANALIVTAALRLVWILRRSLSPKRTVIRQSVLPSFTKHYAPRLCFALLEAVAQLGLPIEWAYGTPLSRGLPLSRS